LNDFLLTFTPTIYFKKKHKQMKKLFLLLASGCIAFGGYAQSTATKTGLLTMDPANRHALTRAQMDVMHQIATGKTATSTQRTTTGDSYWYDAWDENYVSGVSAGYYWVCAPDSIIDNYSPGVTTPYAYTFWTGLGVSFDPTDSLYNNIAGYTTYLSGGAVTSVPSAQSTTYKVDSMGFYFTYVRNNANTTLVDSLIIETSRTQLTSPTTAATDSGCFQFEVAASAGITTYSSDGTPRFGDMDYNCAVTDSNDCMVGATLVENVEWFRTAIPLTAATLADTIPGSGGLIFVDLPGNGATGIICPNSGTVHSNMVSYIHFKSAVYYPVGTQLSAANTIYLYAGQPKGASVWTMQSSSNGSYVGSFQDGLIASNQIRYGEDTSFVLFTGGNENLIPSLAYTTPPGFDVPEISYFCEAIPEKIANVSNAILTKNNAFPNPASDVVNVEYGFTENSNVTVTLSNVLGQTVATNVANNVKEGKATFSTATLADGVYIYTIEANGQRTTGRIAVAH